MSSPPSAEPPPLDLRLTGPAVVVWAVTALLLCLHGSHTDAMFVGAGGLTVGAALLLWRVRWRSVGALLLSAAAACFSTGLAGVALHRGPVAELARSGHPAEVRLSVNTDPHTRDTDGATALRAAVVRVGATATRSPVAVVVHGPAARAWLGLLPSTEVAVTARARPPGRTPHRTWSRPC